MDNILVDIGKWREEYLNSFCLNKCKGKPCCYDIHLYSEKSLKLFPKESIRLCDEKRRGMNVFHIPGKCIYKSKEEKCDVYNNPDKPVECKGFPIEIVLGKWSPQIRISKDCFIVENFEELKEQDMIKSLIEIANKYESPIVPV